jgi:hypothetical protein
MRSFLVGATHCVALTQQRHLPEEGEAVPRPYKLQIGTRAFRMRGLVTQ